MATYVQSTLIFCMNNVLWFRDLQKKHLKLSKYFVEATLLGGVSKYVVEVALLGGAFEWCVSRIKIKYSRQEF